MQLIAQHVAIITGGGRTSEEVTGKWNVSVTPLGIEQFDILATIAK